MNPKIAQKEHSEKIETELSKVIAYLNSLKDDYCFRTNVPLHDYLPAIGFAERKLNSLSTYVQDAIKEN